LQELKTRELSQYLFTGESTRERQDKKVGPADEVTSTCARGKKVAKEKGKKNFSWSLKDRFPGTLKFGEGRPFPITG